MTVKKPSAKPHMATKTVSAKAAKPASKAAAKPAPKSAAKDKPVTTRKVAAAGKPAAARPVPPARIEPRDPVVASADARAEESDYEMSASLLSGPRNVQPYQIRKGEEYMSKEQLLHFRTILASWKNDLMQ